MGWILAAANHRFDCSVSAWIKSQYQQFWSLLRVSRQVGLGTTCDSKSCRFAGHIRNSPHCSCYPELFYQALWVICKGTQVSSTN